MTEPQGLAEMGEVEEGDTVRLRFLVWVMEQTVVGVRAERAEFCLRESRVPNGCPLGSRQY